MPAPANPSQRPSAVSHSQSRRKPSWLRAESKARKQGFRLIIGIDEAGRGPLAGPVVAAAVRLKESRFHNKIADSKQLNAFQREQAFLEILSKADIGVGIVSETVIDTISILKATHHAMAVAVLDLMGRLSGEASSLENASRVKLLIDGNSFESDLEYSFDTIIRGDQRCFSIACASIVAKVTRDRILNTYDRVFPQWGFGRHKGYPTAGHRASIKKFGLAPIHRKSFKPCMKILYDQRTNRLGSRRRGKSPSIPQRLRVQNPRNELSQ